jgi:hypothetical protein
LTVFSVFDMLMVILLCFSLKVADVSLSESGHLVPWWLTSHIRCYPRAVSVKAEAGEDR